MSVIFFGLFLLIFFSFFFRCLAVLCSLVWHDWFDFFHPILNLQLFCPFCVFQMLCVFLCFQIFMCLLLFGFFRSHFIFNIDIFLMVTKSVKVILKISTFFTETSSHCWKFLRTKHKISPHLSSSILIFDFGNPVETLLNSL